ncbi:MAG: hypothetical protein JWO06_3372 [Bacteroidota bacterium]|nr:hypothetical protein [Bacteroidota bacterium]
MQGSFKSLKTFIKFAQNYFMKRFIHFISVVFVAILFLSSCKTYDYNNFKVNYTGQAKVLQQPIKFAIDQEDIQKAYTTNILYIRNGAEGTMHSITRKDLVKDDMATLNDFAKGVATEGDKPYGFFRIKIEEYKEASGIAGPMLTGLFLGIGQLFGAPFYYLKVHLTVTAEVYDANKNLVKEYSIDAKGKAATGGYGDYKTKEVNRVSNIRALNEALKELTDSITADSKMLNSKLLAAGPNKFDGMGTFSKDKPTDGSAVKGGTAFVISDKGYVVTNFHVVQGASRIELYFKEDTALHVYNATFVTADKTNDVAILKIDDNAFKGFDKLPYTISDDYSVGEKVFTIGYPQPELMGTDYKYTSGEINSMSGIENDVTMLQISVPIQPGNSGGPLFNEKGDVVGITTSTLNPFYTAKFGNSIPQNVNYAVKADYVKAVIKPYADKPSNVISDKGTKEKVNLLSHFTCRVKVY